MKFALFFAPGAQYKHPARIPTFQSNGGHYEMSWTSFTQAIKEPALLNSQSFQSLSQTAFTDLAKAEAKGAAAWARWKPQVAGKGDANLDIDIKAAIAANFKLTEEE